jgi:thiamine-monophosphate kinase
MTEPQIIADLLRQFGSQQQRGKRGSVTLGIGDDAALLRVGTARLVWTIDCSVEDIHFRRDWLSLSEIGYRATQAAVSDIAAMGATPLAMLANLAAPGSFARREIGQIAKGQARAARELRCPVVGGNLTRAAALSVTTTVLGALQGAGRAPLLRSGAKVGDELWLLGRVGLARAGLLSLQSGARSRSRALTSCVAAWRRPQALIKQGQSLIGRAHAAIDVSDGLAEDAGRIATASRVKLVIDQRGLLRALPKTLHDAARALPEGALDLALIGGEDYALLATGPRAKRPKGAAVIGEVAKGNGVVVRNNGRERPLSARGFDHFR